MGRRKRKPPQPPPKAKLAPQPATPVVPPAEVILQVPMSQEVYSRERDLLIDIERKSAESHDQAILNLAAAALGISITFIDSIAPKPIPFTLWLLVASWGALIASILLMLRSFLVAQEACRYQRERYDKEMLNQEVEGDQTNKYSDRTASLTKWSYRTFVIGVAGISLFSAFNLLMPEVHGAKVNEQETIRDSPTAASEHAETGQRDSAAEAARITAETPNEVKEATMPNERRDTALPKDDGRKQLGQPTPNRPVAPPAPSSTNPPPSNPKK